MVGDPPFKKVKIRWSFISGYDFFILSHGKSHTIKMGYALDDVWESTIFK